MFDNKKQVKVLFKANRLLGRKPKSISLTGGEYNSFSNEVFKRPNVRGLLPTS